MNYMEYCNIVVNTGTKATDRLFTYRIPTDLRGKIRIGEKVLVPFGKGNKLLEGFVFEPNSDEAVKKIRGMKEIKKVINNDTNLSENQIDLCKWLKETYLCTYSEAIQCLIPKFYSEINTKTKKVAMINFDPKELDSIVSEMSKKAYKQIEVLKILSKVEKVQVTDLIQRAKTSRAVINGLEKKSLIKIVDEKTYRSPINPDEIQRDKPNMLNDEQLSVYNNILETIKKNEHETFLLHGVTGSGKTEVYMHLVSEVVNRGEQVIILVPEISLTPQIVGKFIKRFGNNVAVLHSKLSQGERYDQWKKIKDNEISIVVGARSAIFAPCGNLGLIIIDEEHESSYKSEMNPKYYTIDVAKYLCRQNKAVLLLGSATPSIESYYNAKNGVYELLELNNRFNNNPLPSVDIVDMRIELEEGNKSMFSRRLYESMKESLLNKKQVILFLNRRGYSTFVSCRSCGYVVKCMNCDISMTYHHKKNIAKCHYCGYNSVVPKTCPECGSKYIKFFGSGTEKVEQYVNKLFPSFKTRRLDIDTTSKKGHLEGIIKAFGNREIDILIGTQMVAKGLDFPYVTLVGILSADITLNLPDYRANERTFQLLTQVAGRAGRHDFKGNVVIQTYSPDNYAIISSQKQDFKEFYDKEIELRREFCYPPFHNIINIIVLGKDERAVIKSANRLFQKLESETVNNKELENIQLLGPNPAIHNKIKSFYRWQILLKYQSIDHEIIKGIINNICNVNKSKYLDSNVHLIFDLKPYNIF
ncbi:primosomal protein N' [Wukongibacter baidiensis]|uniref:primosomal protein N' n=1 Tax=Wukongibacter baidiensis TaxID=1723361 RepID=UPI003D7F752F